MSTQTPGRGEKHRQGLQGYMQPEFTKFGPRPCPLRPLPVAMVSVRAGRLGTRHSEILFTVSTIKTLPIASNKR